MKELEKKMASQPQKTVPTEWRAQILKKATAQQTRDVPATESRPLGWLREVLWPYPQAWGALAAVWIVIAAFKFSTPNSTTANAGEIAKNQTISVSEQRRELAHLLDATPDKSSRSPANRPRSARVIPQSFV
jgi:hypothetical protein